MIPTICVVFKTIFSLDILSDQNENIQAHVNFGWKIFDARLLFQALYMWLTSTYIYNCPFYARGEINIHTYILLKFIQTHYVTKFMFIKYIRDTIHFLVRIIASHTYVRRSLSILGCTNSKLY